VSSSRAAAAKPGAALGLIGAGASALFLFAALVAVGALGGVGWDLRGTGAQEGTAAAPSATALRDIPPLYLHLYEQAAARYGLQWAVLAGIGKVECDHGRDSSPSCTVEGAVNQAGAGGPMQFLASTWATYGVDADGDGRSDRWDPADAIYAAARFLRACGAPSEYRRAILAYNHAQWYVEEVERWARVYGEPAGSESGAIEAEPVTGADLALVRETTTPVRFIAGTQARLDPGDGHVAMIPMGVPAVVQAMLVAGNELQDLPYGPLGHPDPLGATEEDCSSTVNYVLYRAGVRPRAEILADNPLAQDYSRWGQPGPGRWVTIYATSSPTPHVFITIAGLRLDTSHNGTDIGPNQAQNGPRWRILPTIPMWAHWAVRHPPGL
jgi:hypothetical protein